MTTTKQTVLDMRAEALDRARNGESVSNFAAIFAGMRAKGIAEHDIRPRDNVLTFNAWKALGRSVKKGEKGVQVFTFVPVDGDEQGEGARTIAKTTYVFHISQTETDAEREARRAAQTPAERAAAREAYRNRPRRGAYQRPAQPRHDIDPGYVDPGELAADRWNETHGDRY